MNNKNNNKIREIFGFTFQNQLESHESWFVNAISFHEASIVLYESKENINQGFQIFLYNAALSLELILKATLAARGDNIPASHILNDLCSKVGISFDKDRNCTLELLTECFLWLSRYPVPTSEKKWNNYHDVKLKKHKICSQSGNTNTIRANPMRFPSIENYTFIWNKCLKQYKDYVEKI